MLIQIFSNFFILRSMLIKTPGLSENVWEGGFLGLLPVYKSPENPDKCEILTK